jgi:vacuolar-type H+-ATPase subunit E/Vma4
MADPRDRSLVENILQEMGLEIPVSYEVECIGGLIAGSADGEIVVINTMEARLERAIPNLRRYLAALFEEEQPVNVIGKQREHVSSH